MRLALALAPCLIACGAAAPPSTVPAPASEIASAAIRSAVLAQHRGARIVTTHTIGGRTLALYVHSDAALATSAFANVCGQASATESNDACAHLAVARLAADGTSIDAALELGCTDEDDGGIASLEAGDIDGDGRDELAITARSFVVIDTETFAVQHARSEAHFAIEYPEGTGLYDTCWHERSGHHVDVGDAQEDFEFEDQVDQPAPTFIDGEVLDAHCETFRMRYDPAADCWRMPPST